MVDRAKREPVRDERLSVRLDIRRDVRCVEQACLLEPADGAAAGVLSRADILAMAEEE
jgi:hypothetical protein